MLHSKAVKKTILELIRSLQNESHLRDFFLVGGTGLAMHFGHRKSEDIDLFSITDFDQDILLEVLESEFNFGLDYVEKNTLTQLGLFTSKSVKKSRKTHFFHTYQNHIHLYIKR